MVSGNGGDKRPPGFNNVVSEICRGQYVLVLGSDIMLDKNYNTEANGDSTRFFLERVIESKNQEGMNCRSAGTFTELILNNALDSKQVRRWLLDEIATLEFDLEDITPDLVKLLSTKCFRVVLTTVFDPSVERLMDEVWGKGKYRIMSVFNNKDRNFDFERSELLGDEYFDIPPTLYYVFGKADPQEPELKFVLDDNDTLDCISRWLGNEAPSKLLSYIDTKKLLVLGCNLKDWCFRFFWYAMRHKSADNLNKGDIAVLLQPEKSEQDKNLYDYLDKTIRVRLQTNSREYIHRLAEALEEGKIADSALTMSKVGGVFISYATEDYAIAWSIFTRLREAGFNVWLDNRKLSVSDQYDKRIERAIEQCRIFIPLLSATVASDLSDGKERYYRHEWELATGENSTIEYFPIVTMCYDYRKDYHQRVPDKIRKVTVFDWSKEPFSNLVAKIESTLKYSPR